MQGVRGMKKSRFFDQYLALTAWEMIQDRALVTMECEWQTALIFRKVPFLLT